jgi:hypothetical protein
MPASLPPSPVIHSGPLELRSTLKTTERLRRPRRLPLTNPLARRSSTIERTISLLLMRLRRFRCDRKSLVPPLCQVPILFLSRINKPNRQEINYLCTLSFLGSTFEKAILNGQRESPLFIAARGFGARFVSLGRPMGVNRDATKRFFARRSVR